MHRTASLNEESARYSELASDFYIPEPEHWAMNTTLNKQSTVQYNLDQKIAYTLHKALADCNSDLYRFYEQLLRGWRQDYNDINAPADLKPDDDGNLPLDMLDIPPIAREQARMILSVNIYTQCVWKIDLKNLLHYLKLRTDAHAQYEIRVFADAIARATEALFPFSWKSFKDNFIDGANFSKTELDLLNVVTLRGGLTALKNHLATIGWKRRRWDEFTKKLVKAGFYTQDVLTLTNTELWP